MNNINTQHSNHAAIARISSSAQPALQDGTSAAHSLEATGTLSDLTSNIERSPAKECSPEILLNIFSRLPFKDIKQAHLVCKDWEIATREKIKVVVKAKNSENLKSALNSFRSGRESHIEFSDGFEFMPNWENIEPNAGVKSLTITSSYNPSNLTDEKLVTLLQRFPNLEKLNLSSCRSLQFDSLDTWPTLNDVKELDLSWNMKLTDEKLAALLRKFPNLEKLDISGCSSLQFNSVDTWPTLNAVKELNLSDNDELTDKKLTALLQKFPNLEKLDLRGYNSLQLNSVDTWPTLNDVKELNFPLNTKFTDKKLAALLQKFPNLKKLDLRGYNSLKFNSVDMWPNLNAVKELNLSGNDELTSKKLAALLQKFPNLEKLNLSGCESLKFNSLNTWPTLNAVKELNLSANDELTDNKLAALLRKFPNLEKLNLRDCESLQFNSLNTWPTLNAVKELNFSRNELTDEKLTALLHKLPNLEKLDLRSCESLQFNSADTWPTLNAVKELNLFGNAELTDEKLAALLQKFPNLEKLNLSGCRSLEFNSVDTWPTLNDVKELNLSWNTKLTDEKLAALLQKFPNLEKLDITECDSLEFDSVDTWPTLENLKEIRRGWGDPLREGNYPPTAIVAAALNEKYPNLEIIEEESNSSRETDSD